MNRTPVFILHLQCGPEGGAVLDEQPMAGRDRRHAAAVEQGPDDDARENFLLFRVT